MSSYSLSRQMSRNNRTMLDRNVTAMLKRQADEVDVQTLMAPSTDNPLAVTSWEDYIGQDKIKKQLSIFITAAKQRKETLPPILLAGAPGFGKSSLARITAAKMGVKFCDLMMPVKPRRLSQIFMSLPKGAVVLLDEIHRLTKREQENFLPVLQDGRFKVDTGSVYDVSHLSFIAATTEPNKLIAPLAGRFKVTPRFRDYSDDEMARILAVMADKLDVPATETWTTDLAPATAGIPRQAEQLVIAAQALLESDIDIDPATVLEFCDIGPDGLNIDHIDYLQTLFTLGGYAGASKLTASLNWPEGQLLSVEQFLVRRGLIRYGEVGRELTPDGHIRLREER